VFTASIHVTTALCFVLLMSNSPQSSAPLVDPALATPPVPPTDYEVPPAAASDVRHTSSSGRSAPPSGGEDNTSVVDSDTEYGSVVESIEPAVDNANVILNVERELHLGQLMESIL